MKKLVILGNGGYSRTLQDVAEQLGYNLLVPGHSECHKTLI